MRALPHCLPSLLRYLVVLILTFSFWLGFVHAEDAMLAPCTEPGRCTVFLDFALHDPWCVVDPTCVSPLYDPAAGTGMASPWEGLRWVTDRALISGTGIEMLAVPNYVLFLLLAAGTIVLVTRGVREGVRRRMLLTAVLVWCALEIARWLLTAAAFTDSGSTRFVIESAALLLISGLLLGAAVYMSHAIWRTRTLSPTRHSRPTM